MTYENRGSAFEAVAWRGDHVSMLDQRRLPLVELYREYKTWQEVADGIVQMVVRGAPAIGIAAAFGVVLAAREHGAELGPALAGLAATRPTAVNLFWALDRMQRRLEALVASGEPLVDGLLAEAIAIRDEDIAMCRAIGEHGAPLLPMNARVLTHCNAGALATGGYGTALGVIRSAHAQGRLSQVYADETRPFLQGARLTAWELARDAIPVRVLCDNMAAHMMRLGRIDAVIVGTDRVAANGDVANKIGTYGLAVLCRAHNIPLYVAAPASTIDLATPTGADIPIEERPAREVTHVSGVRIVPEGVDVENPAFDVTPADLVTAIITQSGVAKAPYDKSLPAHVGR